MSIHVCAHCGATSDLRVRCYGAARPPSPVGDSAEFRDGHWWIGTCPYCEAVLAVTELLEEHELVAVSRVLRGMIYGYLTGRGFVRRYE
jgi:hypothetical protein